MTRTGRGAEDETMDAYEMLAKLVRTREVRSGTPTTLNGDRRRKMVTITLSPEALARLDALAAARGQSRSGAMEHLVRNARLREPSV